MALCGGGKSPLNYLLYLEKSKNNTKLTEKIDIKNPKRISLDTQSHYTLRRKLKILISLKRPLKFKTNKAKTRATASLFRRISNPFN